LFRSDHDRIEIQHTERILSTSKSGKPVEIA
jgi:hypothetical protein